MKNVMLDLETMSTGSDAAIVAIGAVEFVPEDNILLRRFYATVDLESAMKEGGEVDGATVMWWLRQSEEARNALSVGTMHVRDALSAFACWVDSNSLVWGNGAGFDNVVLGNAFRRVGWTVPWNYKNNRCYRTMKVMRPDIVLEQIGTKHNALGDAESQAVHLMNILSKEK